MLVRPADTFMLEHTVSELEEIGFYCTNDDDFCYSNDCRVCDAFRIDEDDLDGYYASL